LSQTSEIVSTEIIERLLILDHPSREDINRIKIEVCRLHRSPTVPPNSDLLQRVAGSELVKLKPMLTGKQIRSASGVTTVAVMPKPYACPHGKCTYCPGGPEVGVPRAYTGQEPAVMRALENEYDPYLQVQSRIAQLHAIGHSVDKVELILVGGTFPFLPRTYQEDFVKQCLDALNGTDSPSLEEAKHLAESAKIRNVGITVETRPDWSRVGHVDHMLSMGVTRVEIGVQTLYDDVYERIHRDHTVADVVRATQVLKDSGIKVGYHMMLGLPGCDTKRDLDAFKRIFADPDFKPDMLKIYPCLVTPGTQLYEEWKRGEYNPYSTEESARLIAEVKQHVPRWVRIMRIQREIPVEGITDGVKHGNLRQFVQQELTRRGMKCHCIRCREAGISYLRNGESPDLAQVQLERVDYEGSGGTDIFLSFEDSEHDILVGYVRVRIPTVKAHRPEIAGQDTAIIRELHVFGQTVPVGQRLAGAFQHKGYGSMLLAEAESISREEYDRKKMLVISALGTKAYYSRFGYAHDGPYVSKNIT
jgi:elongator complex protein 3